MAANPVHSLSLLSFSSSGVPREQEEEKDDKEEKGENKDNEEDDKDNEETKIAVWRPGYDKKGTLNITIEMQPEPKPEYRERIRA